MLRPGFAFDRCDSASGRLKKTILFGLVNLEVYIPVHIPKSALPHLFNVDYLALLVFENLVSRLRLLNVGAPSRIFPGEWVGAQFSVVCTPFKFLECHDAFCGLGFLSVVEQPTKWDKKSVEEQVETGDIFPISQNALRLQDLRYGSQQTNARAGDRVLRALRYSFQRNSIRGDLWIVIALAVMRFWSGYCKCGSALSLIFNQGASRA